LLKIVF